MVVPVGAVVLFGSGESATVGREALRWLAASGRAARRVAVLETPAGFEPNAAAVARRWTEFLERQDELVGAAVSQLPLHRRGDAGGTDDPIATRALLGADLVACGAGSPTYTVRQLRGSLAWQRILAAHASGMSLFLASAAAIAAGTLALPVYEIYKVGEDAHWKVGLGTLEAYGLSLAVVPHWDNGDGGVDLDTSRAFMGVERFACLRAALPPEIVIVGIDEHTALAMDPAAGSASVLGRGAVTIIRDGVETTHAAGAVVPLGAFGPFRLPDLAALVPADVAALIRAERAVREEAVPAEVAALIAEREQARALRAWTDADALRLRIASLGWAVDDTAEGPRARRG